MAKFAISPKLRKDVVTLLTETRDFIAKHPKRWTKNYFARSKDGRRCSAVSPEAKEFCALGFAINRAADLFGYEVLVATPDHRFIDTEDGGDEYTPGEKVYRLNKHANAVYDRAQRALDRATEVYTNEEDDGVMDFNDGDAKTVRDIVKVYDAAIELVSA